MTMLFSGYDLRVIAYDDGPNDYPQEVWHDIRQYPFLQYLVGEDDDMGISLGRNLALKMVKTKYFLLVDDDHVFNDKTNLDKVGCYFSNKFKALSAPYTQYR